MADVNLSARIGLNAGSFLNPLNQARVAMSGFRTSLQTLGNMGNIVTGLNQSFQLVRGSIQGVQDALRAGGNVEGMQASFEMIAGSGNEARRILGEVREQAISLGASFDNQAGAIRRFMAMGFSTDQALELNRSIMDISGALRMSREDAGLLAVGLAQVAAKGVASMEELRGQIAERGVPVFDMLAKKLNVTQGELMDMIAAGKVSADTVVQGFMKLEGPLARFRGGAAQMAGTWNGLTDVIGTSFDEIRRGLMSGFTEGLKPELEAISRQMQGIARESAGIGTMIAKGFRDEKIGEIVGLSLQIGMMEAGNNLAGVLQTAVRVFRDGFVAAMQSIGDALLGTLLHAFRGSAAEFQARIEATMSLTDPKNLKDVVTRRNIDADILPFQYRRRERAAAEGDQATLADSEAEIAAAMKMAAELDAKIAGGTVADRKARILSEGVRIQTANGELTAEQLSTRAQSSMAMAMEEIVAAAKAYQPGKIWDSSGVTAELQKIFQGLRVGSSNRTDSGVAEGSAGVAGTGNRAASRSRGIGQVDADMWARVGAFVGGGANQQVSEQRRTNALLTSSIEIWKNWQKTTFNPKSPAVWT